MRSLSDGCVGLLAVLVASSACDAGQRDLAWTIRFMPGDPQDPDGRIEARVRSGGCEGAVVFATTDGAPRAPDDLLAPGLYGFEARAWRCRPGEGPRIYASGCTERELPTDGEIVTALVMDDAPCDGITCTCPPPAPVVCFEFETSGSPTTLPDDCPGLPPNLDLHVATPGMAVVAGGAATVDSHFQLQPGFLLAPPKAVTVELWVDPPAAPAEPMEIVEIGDCLRLVQTATGELRLSIGAGVGVANAALPAVERFVHVAATLEEGAPGEIAATLYLDGLSVAVRSGTAARRSDAITLGNGDDSLAPFDGRFESVRFYDAALSDEHIEAAFCERCSAFEACGSTCP